MIIPLAYHTEGGDPADIDNREYFFERIDVDSSVYYRAPAGAAYPDFMVDDANGHPRRPTTVEMNKIFAAERIILRGRPLSKAARRLARNKELDADQCRKMDSRSPFRNAMTKHFDKHAQSLSLSDDAMLVEIGRALADPKIAKLNTSGWAPHPSTVRQWLRDRGKPGQRKLRDGVSMAGRYERMLVTFHPTEIFVYYLYTALTNGEKRQVQHAYDQYDAEITRINNGKQLNRKALVLDEEGIYRVSEDWAHYDKPETPYKAVSYHTFWRRCGEERTPRLFGLATTLRGERSRYGGGGFSEKPAFGSLCEMDETPTPSVFLVDDDTGIGMGEATLTLMLECTTKALVGWDLCAEAASGATLLRTVRHANSIKTVPQDLLDEFPDLPFIRLRPDRIKVDNSSGAHSQHFEDACADAYIQVNFMGKEHPTHKSLVERTIGTTLQMLFKKLPDHNYDTEFMRKLGFKPDKQVLCTLSKARELLDRAVFTYNVSTGKRL